MLSNLFNAPSAFETDPKGYVVNQIGHVAIGAALCWLLGPFAAFGAYAAWEVAQWRYRGAEAYDCLEDAAFAGVGVLALTVPLTLAPAAIFLASGVLRRRKNARI